MFDVLQCIVTLLHGLIFLLFQLQSDPMVIFGFPTPMFRWLQSKTDEQLSECVRWVRTSFSVWAKAWICKTRLRIRSISDDDDEADKELVVFELKRWKIDWGEDVGKSWLKPAILYSSPGRLLAPLDVEGSGKGTSIGYEATHMFYNPIDSSKNRKAVQWAETCHCHSDLPIRELRRGADWAYRTVTWLRMNTRNGRWRRN